MKTVELKAEEKINRRSWVDQFYVEIDQVQKRFNYFLIACSILLFAFAFTTSGSLATGTGNGTWIAYPIAVMGAFLAFYFFWINYYQWRIAETVRSRHFTQPVTEEKLESGEWLCEGWYAAWKYPVHALKYPGNLIAGYTWFVPFVVFLLWLVIIGIRMGAYGFSLIAIPAGVQFWFARHTISQKVRTTSIWLGRHTSELSKKTSIACGEIKANASLGLGVAKQAITRLVQRMWLFSKTASVVGKNCILKSFERLSKVSHRFSGAKEESVLNPEDPK